jgi:hypothetical protein
MPGYHDDEMPNDSIPRTPKGHEKPPRRVSFPAMQPTQTLCSNPSSLRTRLGRLYAMRPNSKSRRTSAEGQPRAPFVVRIRNTVFPTKSRRRARGVARALQIPHSPLDHLFADAEQAVVHVLEDTQLCKLHVFGSESSRGLNLRPVAVGSSMVL